MFYSSEETISSHFLLKTHTEQNPFIRPSYPLAAPIHIMVSMCTAKVNYVLKPLMDVTGQSYALNRSYCQICGESTISSEILNNTIWNYWKQRLFYRSLLHCMFFCLLAIETRHQNSWARIHDIFFCPKILKFSQTALKKFFE